MTTPEDKGFRIPSWLRSPFAQGALVVLLWLASAAFSFYACMEFQQMVLRRIVTGDTINRLSFNVVRQWSTILAVGVWLAFVITTEEYHFKRMRRGVNWQVFGWSFAGWVVVLLLALLL